MLLVFLIRNIQIRVWSRPNKVFTSIPPSTDSEEFNSTRFAGPVLHDSVKMHKSFRFKQLTLVNRVIKSFLKSKRLANRYCISPRVIQAHRLRFNINDCEWIYPFALSQHMLRSPEREWCNNKWQLQASSVCKSEANLMTLKTVEGANWA